MSSLKPQLMSTNIASVYYDKTDKKLYVHTENEGGILIGDYNNTIPRYGDLRLTKKSPGIDAVDPATFPTGITKDYDNNDRVQQNFATTPQKKLTRLRRSVSNKFRIGWRRARRCCHCYVVKAVS